jgi:two-component system OmpR family sensor kinase
LSRRRGAPIAVQVGLLIAACLIAAQLIALAVVTLSPPPAPQVYRVSEIAAALQGGSLQPRLGRTLLRSVSDEPPHLSAFDARPASPRRERNLMKLTGNRFGGDRQAADLASQLGVPIEKVRLVRPLPNWLVRALSGRFPQPLQQGGGDRALTGAPGPPPPFRDNPAFGRRGGARNFEFDLVGGAFIASVQTTNGKWTVVRSSPEPFPNDWERKVALWLAGCLVLAVPAVWWFARRITAPIQQFAQAAERLGRDPHAPLIALDGPAEIGTAAGAFNEMQARLKRYVNDRTAMVGAISHDLRTPLARIRFKLEAKTPDPAAILSDVEKMEAMIASVLAFIRDAAAIDQREDLDLLSVVEVVVDDAALIGGDVQLVDAVPLTVRGDAVALQRLIANLVDNALKYGAAARVHIRQIDGQAVIEIEDDGPGLSSAELARVFEPFYRADASRNLDQGGVGLGLAVARSLARAHGGDVDLISRPGGLTARVSLPLV